MSDTRFASLRPRFEPFLLSVERPGRYLGLERNVTRKELSAAAVTVCLAFPDTYEIGMSHTGTKILYEIVNRRAGWACERAYAPWVDFEAVMRRERIPLFSVESFAPARDFDVLGFSLQSELNYTNVPNLLDLAGIPLLSADRGDGDPLVVGGGPCVANPEPVADFFDLFLIGDGEEAFPRLLEEVERTKGLRRRERLLRLAAIPGVYVPSFYDVVYDGDRVASYAPNAPGVPERALRVWVERLSAGVYAEKPMVPSVEIVQDRLGLEIMRGCTQGCRFCQAGYWYRPVRELDPADVARATTAFIDEAGWSEVGLLSLSSADYSQIEPLVACLAPELAKTKVSISLPSLRAEAFSVALADAVSEVRRSGFTFAPETGSDRLRRVINKTFTNADMVRAAAAAFSRGWDLIKVYTMIGLPTETDADLDELVTLVRDILAEGKKHGVRPTVHVSVGSFVPKSFTPFQWSPFDGVANLERKLALLKEKFRTVKGAKLKWHAPKEAEIEALLSLGDRRMSRALLEVFRRGGRFDGWSEHFSWERWNAALEAAGIPKERHLRPKDLKETLPWDVVDAFIRKPFLVVEWKKALREGETEDCKWGRCTACGVPGNGEDTVLAAPLPGDFSFGGEKALPSLAPAPPRPAPAAAAYRRRDLPDLPPLAARRTVGDGSAAPVPATARTYRVSFEKLDDARYLSHRNVMDLLERAFRAARAPIRYTEGYNPHLRLSMGPALPLGQESRHELFDVDTLDALTEAHRAAVNARLPGGVRITGWTELPKGAPSLGKAATEAVYRFVLPDGETRVERLRIAGEGATTPKRFLESTFGLAPEDQHAIRVVREETLLTA
ncbi:MAG TPA: TIGR03960 family B12-binding radical SAM protein [Thermoanaerobaculia bacterium]|nr:TIGR03960 family B12-binding radical SAM protein [Thermoanaerobaculia bacterium]HQR66579.1 TIGR03960 family B12-binding radical SAM protein [Thermoanaerobaculia bacterium]